MSIRFDLKSDSYIHDGIGRATLRALRAVGDRIYIAGQSEVIRHVQSEDVQSGALIARFDAALPEGHLRVWSPGAGYDRDYAPGESIARIGALTIAKYANDTAWNHRSVLALIEKWLVETAPKPKPALWLHLAVVGHRDNVEQVFPLKWGESAPPEVIRFVLEHALYGRKIAGASISSSPTCSSGSSPGRLGRVGETMVGSEKVQAFVLGAKLEEVWPCK